MKSSLKPLFTKLALLSVLVCVAIAAPLLPTTKAKKEAKESAVKNSRLVNMATLQSEKKGEDTSKEGGNEASSPEYYALPYVAPKNPLPGSGQTKGGSAPNRVAAAVGQSEVEPNNTFGTANALASTDVKVTGNLFPNADVDWYSFTATAGDHFHGAIMTSFSANASSDSQLRLFQSDGTTLIEFDDDDGALGGLSSTIAGATLASGGTYYLEVRHFSATNQLRPYELWVKVQSGAPTPEVESNDTPATANVLPASGYVSGARNPAAATEQDWYSMTLAAGDTVFLSLDIDPERDNVQWNGRLGLALFGDANNQILVVDDASTGSVANPLSEAFFMTVKDAGTYFAFVDSASAATGGPTATYNLSVSILPHVPVGVNCTTYTSTNVPQTIGPGAGSVSSTITVPGNPRIESIRVSLNITHALMGDMDIHLISPAGNDNGLLSDIGAAAVGGQTMMDLTLDDNAGIPPLFTVMRPIIYKPELAYRLGWFKGENAGGTWTLQIRDDTTNASGGTLNGWSIEICEAPAAPTCGSGSPTTVFTTDFESGDAGFTHSGTADEWELGNPTFAPVTGANSGTNAWKTDLDNTYNASSIQDLLSPPINLAGSSGPVTLSWAMKYQIENATFDHAFVEVRQVGGATPVRVWEFFDATMTDTVGSPAVTINESAGWGVYTADISSFAGQNIEVRFHLDTDTSVQLAGLAIDDVSVIACVAGGCALTCPANITQTNDPNQCGAVVTYAAPTTTGTCGTVTCSPASGSFFPVGTTTVTCSEPAVPPRGTGGPATCTFTVTVTDDQAPSITCPANITTVNDANQCGAVVAYPAPTVTDNCPGTFTATCTPASGSFFPVGTTTVTCEVDAPPNRASAPAGACMPVTITHSSSQAIVPLNSVACTDNLTGFTTANSYWRAFSLPAFSIPTAFDVLSVDIAIEEATAGAVAKKKGGSAPPSGSGKAGKPVGSGKGFHKKQGTSSPSGGSQPVTVNLYQSSSAFPTGFPGSLTLIGTANVMVADQSGTILNVPITGTVAAGGELVVEVAVPDGITAGNTFFIGSNDSAETGPSYLSAADCGVTTPTDTAAIGFPDMNIVMNVNGCPQGGGGGSSCTFTVTVNDTQAPVITCPTDVTAVTPACGGNTSVVNYPAPTASDNCPGVTTACVPPSGSVFAIGVTTVTCTATDGSGNTATCSFMVSLFNACLQDDTNPNTVLLWNTATGAYRFCCNGSVFTGVGVVLNQDQSHSISHAPVDKRIHGVLDCSTGRGEGGLQSNAGSLVCTINDRNITNNTCACGGAMALPGTTTKQ